MFTQGALAPVRSWLSTEDNCAVALRDRNVSHEVETTGNDLYLTNRQNMDSKHNCMRGKKLMSYWHILSMLFENARKIMWVYTI